MQALVARIQPHLARRRLWFALLVLCSTLLALAYSGPLQRGLDLWTAGRTTDALAEFRKLEGTGELARLNRLIVEGEVALATEPSDARRRTLTRVAGDLAVLAQGAARKGLALHHAGRFTLASGETERGLRLLESAYRQDPRRQDFANPLLEALLAGKEHTRLRECARHHLDLRPDNPTAWYALGVAERRAGFPKRALTNWSKGIEVFPLRSMLEAAIPLAWEQGRKDLAKSWLEIMRFRYGQPASGQSLEAWCEGLGLKPLLALLSADTESRRYADRFSEFFPAGREWTYKVRYGIIPLGLLKVGVKGREDIRQGDRKQEAWRVYYKIDSNPAYRVLIDLHDTYEALIPAHCLHSQEFVLHSREGENRSDRIYTFDQDHQRFVARGYHRDGDVFRQELPLARQVFDGLSLLFAARRQVRENRYGTVLTIVDEEVHKTVIRYKGRSTAKIMDRPRKVVDIHGQADYQGIAGLTGEFWGQFSDDKEALPLAARFQIKVGKISLELSDVQ